MQPDSKGWMVAGIAWDARSQGKAFTQIFTDYFSCPSVSPLSPVGKARLFCSQKAESTKSSSPPPSRAQHHSPSTPH